MGWRSSAGHSRKNPKCLSPPVTAAWASRTAPSQAYSSTIKSPVDQIPWEKLYDPARKIMNLEYVKENSNTVAQYKDLLTPGEAKSIDEISPGHGAVLRDGLTKIAVFRDEKGAIPQMLGHLHPPAVRGELEPCRTQLGLPLPWQPV